MPLRIPCNVVGALASVALIGSDAMAAQAQMISPDTTCPSEPVWSDYPEMRFTVREEDGQAVLLAEGVIDDGLVPRLRSAIDSFQGEEIRLRSPGGNGRVAREAGIILKHRGLSTRIAEGSACAGAFSFLFMGGVVRTVEPGGYIMLEVSPGAPPATSPGAIEAATAREVSEISDFLIHAGISRNLISDMLYRSEPATNGRPRWYCPTHEELVRYNVTPRNFRLGPSAEPGETDNKQ